MREQRARGRRCAEDGAHGEGVPAPTLARLLGSWQLDPGVLVVLRRDGGALWMRASSGAGRQAGRCARSAAFLAGLLVLVDGALLSGIDTYADELLSVHVVQHLLLILRRAGAAAVGRAGAAGAERVLPRGRARAIGAVLRQRCGAVR